MIDYKVRWVKWDSSPSFKHVQDHHNDTEWREPEVMLMTEGVFIIDPTMTQRDADFHTRIRLMAYYLPLIALVAAACELVGLSLWSYSSVAVWLLAVAVKNVEEAINAAI